MTSPTWELSAEERRTLEQVLDVLIPPSGSFPLPSQTNVIDEFILMRVPAVDEPGRLYPGIDAPRLKAILAQLRGVANVSEALARLEREKPQLFQSLWSLAVYGYYSRSETIAAIQRDLTPAYHGAPLPLGYTDAMEPWNAGDPLQLPCAPRGSYVPTDAVRRVDLTRLSFEEDRP